MSWVIVAIDPVADVLEFLVLTVLVSWYRWEKRKWHRSLK